MYLLWFYLFMYSLLDCLWRVASWQLYTCVRVQKCNKNICIHTLAPGGRPRVSFFFCRRGTVGLWRPQLYHDNSACGMTPFFRCCPGRTDQLERLIDRPNEGPHLPDRQSTSHILTHTPCYKLRHQHPDSSNNPTQCESPWSMRPCLTWQAGAGRRRRDVLPSPLESSRCTSGSHHWVIWALACGWWGKTAGQRFSGNESVERKQPFCRGCNFYLIFFAWRVQGVSLLLSATCTPCAENVLEHKFTIASSCLSR
jgi:hypothetical protein